MQVYQAHSRRGAPWKYGWGMALMEMVVDPVLCQWVPEYVLEQYKRWNPKFSAALRGALQEEVEGETSNRQLLKRAAPSHSWRRRRSAWPVGGRT